MICHREFSYESPGEKIFKIGPHLLKLIIIKNQVAYFFGGHSVHPSALQTYCIDYMSAGCSGLKEFMRYLPPGYIRGITPERKFENWHPTHEAGYFFFENWH